MFFNGNSLILAESDWIETIFDGAFIIVWLLIAFAGFISKFLKKGKNEEEETVPLEFSSWDEEAQDEPEPLNSVESSYSADSGVPETTALDALLQQRREQSELARRERWAAIQERIDRQNQAARDLAESAQLPPKPIVLPKPPSPKPQKTLAPSPITAPKSERKMGNAFDILDDREALRRAVLAQEILSPPLALREHKDF